MKPPALVAALVLAVTAPLTVSAHAAPPTPAPPSDPSDVFYFGEAPTGSYEGRYDESNANVEVIDGRWLQLRFYGVLPSGEDGELALYFNTRGGSRFYLTGCDEQNNVTAPVRVSRKEFLQRVATTGEREIDFSYNAERNRGVFTATTGYDVDGDILPCPGYPTA